MAGCYDGIEFIYIARLAGIKVLLDVIGQGIILYWKFFKLVVNLVERCLRIKLD